MIELKKGTFNHILIAQSTTDGLWLPFQQNVKISKKSLVICQTIFSSLDVSKNRQATNEFIEQKMG